MRKYYTKIVEKEKQKNMRGSQMDLLIFYNTL